ncbi:dihydrofolate reductase family protein [Thalassospira australica]|uniref:dihydrofolate reductase family protein n=1 Tax=Thalassospira australica TaxID=1528106 RepID=UPI00384C7CFD
MKKKLFRIYIAVSLDGYIARANGAVDWLDQFDPAEFDFEGFLGTVGTLIIGRKTFDQVMEFGEWPYEDRRTIVLTSRDLPDNRPANTEAYGGSLVELASQLRDDKSDTGDIWIVGGASVVTQFLFGGLVDQLEMFIIPEILGDGIRLFGRDAAGTTPKLIASESYKSGVVRMQYDLR